MVFSFLMINSIWVITVFLLQQNKDLLFIEWPYGAKGPIVTYNGQTQEVKENCSLSLFCYESEALLGLFAIRVPPTRADRTHLRALLRRGPPHADHRHAAPQVNQSASESETVAGFLVLNFNFSFQDYDPGPHRVHDKR